MAKTTKTDRKGTNAKRPTKNNLKPNTGAPFSEQDPKRRLGNFSGAGEHARKGGRTTQIVGQTKKRNHTDKHS
jgi:hypothetical protein